MRLRLAASLTNGSAEELAAALDVVKGVVAEYMPGGDQATEECTCGGSS